MTIQMTFDSFDDMKANVLRMADAFMPDAFTALPEEEEHNTAPMPEPEEEEPATAPVPEPEEEHATAPTPEPEDPDRPGANVPKQPTVPPMPKPEKGLDLAQMRKILSTVNKHTGKNTARELIQAMGYKVLTEMPVDKYPELKAKAEEVLNAD